MGTQFYRGFVVIPTQIFNIEIQILVGLVMASYGRSFKLSKTLFTKAF
ncbi:hypothetical protein LEP1GSC074_3889 [Leptospira noguchii str. Hook]|nr:hypothetical protein LEP1GSC074_3889 [Leptospira noguchii str. Hook]